MNQALGNNENWHVLRLNPKASYPSNSSSMPTLGRLPLSKHSNLASIEQFARHNLLDFAHACLSLANNLFLTTKNNPFLPILLHADYVYTAKISQEVKRMHKRIQLNHQRYGTAQTCCSEKTF